MKTSKQLSEEVLEKIARKNAERAKMKKIIQKTAVAVVIVGILIPTSVYLGSVEKYNKNQPLAKPFENDKSSPAPKEDSSSVESERYFQFEGFEYTDNV